MTAAPDLRYDPFAADAFEDPYPIYARLREEAPVYQNPERGFWVLSRYADVDAATRDWRSFANGAGEDLGDYGDVPIPGSAVSQEPELNYRLRSVAQAAFSRSALEQLEPFVRTTVRARVSRLMEAGRGDLAQELAWPISVATMCRVLGLPPEDADVVQTRLMGIYDRRPTAALPENARLAASQLTAHLQAAAEERRRQPRDDLLSRIATLRIGEARFGSELGPIALLLMIAGTETTGSLIGNALLLLAEHPAQRDLLASRLDLSTSAVEEFLRYDAPLQNHPRVARTDVTLHVTVIPAGSTILLLYGSANRDPAEFSKPDCLAVDRPPRRHLAFGAGVHFCLGAPLARLEARIALEEFLGAVVKHSPDWSRVARLGVHTTRGWTRIPAELEGRHVTSRRRVPERTATKVGTGGGRV